MKIVPLFLLTFFILSSFFACNLQENPKDLAYKCIVDSFGKGKDMVKVAMTEFDSLFLYYNDDPIYKTAKDSMNSYRFKLDMELMDYRNHQRFLGMGYRSMIDFYQKCIKDDLVIISHIHQTHKKKFIGYKSVFYLQYHTDFNDSLILGVTYLTPKRNRIYECFSNGNIELGQDLGIFKEYKYTDNPDSLISIFHKSYDMTIPPATVDTTDFIH